MNAPQSLKLPEVGAAFEGGIFTDVYRQADCLYAIIAAPKAEGQLRMPWNASCDRVEGALSFVDGLANTKAMAAAGSELGQRILDLRIAGRDDWYLPALDETERLYRRLKPSVDKNSQWARSGINLNSEQPSYPYTADEPAQTTVEAFRAGGKEAFDQDTYWTSTQSAAYDAYAWVQHFSYGNQGHWRKDGRTRGRAVRRYLIQQFNASTI
jgi:hypothetical protein